MILAKVWCLPILIAMDTRQHTATHMPQPTAMPMQRLVVAPMHMLLWYEYTLVSKHLAAVLRDIHVYVMICFLSPQFWALDLDHLVLQNRLPPLT